MSEPNRNRGRALLQVLRGLTGSRADVIVTPPGWRLRCSRWLVGLLGCLCCYLPYTFLVVPLIEPPARHGAREEAARSLPYPQDDQSDLIALLGADAWELREPMQLNTQWGSLLFQKYERVGGRIELHPCTVLFRTPGSQREGRASRLIALQTPDRAQLNFAGDLDLMRAQMGKLKEAKLLGPVVIRSPATGAAANDALKIVTRDVQIQPRQIWTPHDVAFEYGASRGSGRVLTIALLGEEAEGRAAADQALVENIDMLELVHVDALHLRFPGTGLLGRTPSPPAADRPWEADPSSAANAVDVTCQGSLQFNFRTGVLTLRDHVDVVRDNPTGEDDQLHCQRLNVHFLPGPSPATPEGARPAELPVADTAAGDSHKVPRLSISRIEALGPDVVLQAPSVQVAARGELLQYDFPTRRIVLQDPANALFAFRSHVTESPRLEYELPDDPQRLGKLWATGPGSYRGVLDADQHALQAFWKGTLELQPQGELHVLSVVEGAELRSESVGAFSADKLFVWLQEVPREAADPPSAGVRPAAFTSPIGDAVAAELLSPPPVMPAPAHQSRFEVVPVKMLAQGHVHADAVQFLGDTAQLEIWFDQPEGPPVLSADPAADSERPPATDAAGNRPAEPPTGDAPRGQKRLELSGTQVRVRVRMTQPKPAVSEATVLGDVHLAQMGPVPGEPALLLVTGDMLQLRVDPLERAAIDVRGSESQKARVHAQGLLLEGSNLHVSQRENLMWSEGPGRTRLPGRKRTENASRAALGGQQAAPDAPVWISWQGGMDFDGQLIRFMKQVEVKGIFTTKKGEQLFMRSAGDQLHAILNRYVEFSQTKQATDDLDVAELRFLGDVYTENQTFDVRNVLASQDRMRARDLTLDRATGQFTAAGPGWLTTTRIDDGNFRNRTAAGPPVPTAVPPAAAPAGQEKLIYLRIDFQNAIQGNLDRKEAELVNYVRTVYGPVSSWDQTLDPDRRGGLGPQGIVMTCNRLKIVDMGDSARAGLELAALGNTIVEGSQFSATADRLNYVEVKDQLIFESEGRNLVTLKQQSQAGAEPAVFQASKIKYGIRSGLVDVEGAVNLQYNQIGAPTDLPRARIR